MNILSQNPSAGSCAPALLRRRPGILRTRAAAVFGLCWLFIAGAAPAASVRFCFTNSAGLPDTNWFRVIPVSGPVANADGSFTTIGLPTRLTPAANGCVTNIFAANNYLVTNSFLGDGYVIRVPQDFGPTVYNGTARPANDPLGLVISGYNTFVTVTYGTNPPPTADQVTNALGYLPQPHSLNLDDFALLSTNLFLPWADYLASSNSVYGGLLAQIIATNNALRVQINSASNTVAGNASAALVATNAAILANVGAQINTASNSVTTNLFAGLALTNTILRAQTAAATNGLDFQLRGELTGQSNNLWTAFTAADAVTSNALSSAFGTRLNATNSALQTQINSASNIVTTNLTLLVNSVSNTVTTNLVAQVNTSSNALQTQINTISMASSNGVFVAAGTNVAGVTNGALVTFSVTSLNGSAIQSGTVPTNVFSPAAISWLLSLAGSGGGTFDYNTLSNTPTLGSISTNAATAYVRTNDARILNALTNPAAFDAAGAASAALAQAVATNDTRYLAGITNRSTNNFITGFLTSQNPNFIAKARVAQVKASLGITNMTVAIIGDSTDMGYGSTSTSPTNCRSLSWPAQLVQYLDNADMDNGFSDSGWGLGVIDSRVTFPTNWTLSTFSSIDGKLVISAPGTTNPITFSITRPCDTFRLYTFNASGKGAYDVYADSTNYLGRVVTTIANGVCSNAVFSVPWGYHNFAVYPISTNSGNVQYQGYRAYTASNSVSIVNFGYSGANSATFNTGLTGIGADAYGAAQFLLNFKPDIEIIGPGINSAHTSGFETVTTYSNNLYAFAFAQQTNGTAICFRTPFPVNTASNEVPYVEAMINVASNLNAGLIDCFHAFGSYSNMNNSGMMFNILHPNQYGYGATPLVILQSGVLDGLRDKSSTLLSLQSQINALGSSSNSVTLLPGDSTITITTNVAGQNYSVKVTGGTFDAAGAAAAATNGIPQTLAAQVLTNAILAAGIATNGLNLTTVSNQTAAIQGLTNSVGVRLNSLEANTNVLNTRVGLLEGATNSLNTTVSGHTASITALNNLTNQYALLNGATNALNTRVGLLETFTNGAAASLTALNNQTNGVANSIMALNAATNAIAPTSFSLTTGSQASSGNSTNYSITLLAGEMAQTINIFLANTNVFVTLTGTNAADKGRHIVLWGLTNTVNSTIGFALPSYHTNTTFSATVSNGWCGSFYIWNPDTTGTNVFISDQGRWK